MKTLKLNGKFKGSFSFEQLKFGQVKTATVMRNNNTSGKIYFPPEDIGKTVYVLYTEEDEDENQK